MPWTGIGTAVAAPLVGTVLGGLFGGGGGPGANVTMLPGMDQMAQQYQGATAGYLPQAQQYYGAMSPQYANQAFQAMYANPYAAAAQQGAAQAGQMAGQFAPQAQQAGMGMMGAAPEALAAGRQIYQTAFDPQQALFDRMQQQTLDQANVINSMYGLGGSTAGAQSANQALQNLDINWQNQQLQRQLQGQGALNTGISAYGQAMQGGLGLGQAGMGLAQQAGALPYQTAQGIAQNQFGAIGQEQAAMQGGLAPYQQNIGNIGNYLGIGMGAQGQQLGAQQQQYQQAQQNAANIAQLGTNLVGRGMSAYYGNPNPNPQQAFANTANANYAMGGGLGSSGVNQPGW